jgi:hypothetical protein
MRTIGTMFAVATLLSGCVTAAERQSIQHDWQVCIMRAVKQLDDGRSDPTSIAYGIAPQCAVLYQQFTDAMVGENITEGGQAHMAGLMRTNELKMITSAILIHRAAQTKRP